MPTICSSKYVFLTFHAEDWVGKEQMWKIKQTKNSLWKKKYIFITTLEMRCVPQTLWFPDQISDCENVCIAYCWILSKKSDEGSCLINILVLPRRTGFQWLIAGECWEDCFLFLLINILLKGPSHLQSTDRTIWGHTCGLCVKFDFSPYRFLLPQGLFLRTCHDWTTCTSVSFSQFVFEATQFKMDKSCPWEIILLV